MIEIAIMILATTLLVGIGAVVILISSLVEQRDHLKTIIKTLRGQRDEAQAKLEKVKAWADDSIDDDILKLRNIVGEED